jgi:hypothetical protein
LPVPTVFGHADELELLLHWCPEPGDDEGDSLMAEVVGQRGKRLEPG